MEKTIEEKLYPIIAEHFSVPLTLVNPEATFAGDFLADSLDMVELVMAVEEVFSVNIDDDEVEKFTKVGDLTDFIKNSGDL
jgi:acyl carrier protein